MDERPLISPLSAYPDFKRNSALSAKPTQLFGDQPDRALYQLFVPVLMNPAARPGGMRQRNHQRLSADVLDDPLGANQLRQRQGWKKFLDRESPDWNQQLRLNDLQLVVEPIRAA